MTLRDKLERANPNVDSPTYRRLTEQITDKDYKKAIEEESRRLQRKAESQAAEGR